MITHPIEKKHGMCLQINSKEKLKEKKIGGKQTGTKDSGTFFFFFCRGVVFYF